MRREPTGAGKAKSVALGPKACGTPIVQKATFSGNGNGFSGNGFSSNGFSGNGNGNGNGEEAAAELRRMCQEVDNVRVAAGTDTLESLRKR